MMLQGAFNDLTPPDVASICRFVCACMSERVTCVQAAERKGERATAAGKVGKARGGVLRLQVGSPLSCIYMLIYWGGAVV